MLTSEDLKAIKETLQPSFDELKDDLVERMDVKFEATWEHFDEEIGKVRNEMVTKDYLDRKLAFYVKKPSEV